MHNINRGWYHEPKSEWNPSNCHVTVLISNISRTRTFNETEHLTRFSEVSYHVVSRLSPPLRSYGNTVRLFHSYYKPLVVHSSVIFKSFVAIRLFAEKCRLKSGVSYYSPAICDDEHEQQISAISSCDGVQNPLRAFSIA